MAGFVAVPSRGDSPTGAAPAVHARIGHGMGGRVTQRFGAVTRDQPPPLPLDATQMPTGAYGTALHYARPYWPNVWTARHNSAVVPYSPYLSATLAAGRPVYAVRTGRRRTDQGTYHRGYGAWSQDYPHGPVVDQLTNARLVRYGPTYARPNLMLTGRWRLRTQPQAKGGYPSLGVKIQQAGPYWPALTTTAPPGSYGQYTTTLPGSPTMYTESVYG